MPKTNVNLQAVRAAQRLVTKIAEELRDDERHMLDVTFRACVDWADRIGGAFKLTVDDCRVDVEKCVKELIECRKTLDKILEILEEYENTRLTSSSGGGTAVPSVSPSAVASGVADSTAAGGVASANGAVTNNTSDASAAPASESEGNVSFMRELEHSKERGIDTSIESCAERTNPNFWPMIERVAPLYREIEEVNDAIITIRQETTYSNYEDDPEYQRLMETADQLCDSYKRETSPYGKNCLRCVVAYELRRRGYDVEAREYTPDDPLADVENSSDNDKLFVGEEFISVGGADHQTALHNLEEHISVDDARYVVGGWFDRDDWGHALIAERLNGQIHYIDPQSANTDCRQLVDRFLPDTIIVCRVDNLRINPHSIERLVRICDEQE